LSIALSISAGCFIGFHLVKRLVAEDEHVCAFFEYVSCGLLGQLDGYRPANYEFASIF